jgi:cellulase
LHKIGDTKTGCAVGGALCSDAATCAKNCALEGVDYAAHGVATKGDALTMNQWLKAADGTYNTVSPRLYLLAENERDYENFQLLNGEFSFDVDVSKLVCGMNGALYLAEMEMDGGRGPLNKAGATYGTGYCDAQCPKLDFINGEVFLLVFCLFPSKSPGPLMRIFSSLTPTIPTARAATRWTSWRPMLLPRR